MPDMPSLTKKPIHIYLRPDQLTALRKRAAEQNKSVSELVRQAVDLLLASSLADEPLLHIVGLGDSGVNDLAANHDHYLTQ